MVPHVFGVGIVNQGKCLAAEALLNKSTKSWLMCIAMKNSNVYTFPEFFRSSPSKPHRLRSFPFIFHQ